MNIFSRSDALSLLDKLREEKSEVHTVFSSVSGLRGRITGTFAGSSTGADLVSLGDGKHGYVSIPFSDRPCRMTFSDKRELPAELEDLADKWGNCSLTLSFDTGDFLAFIFYLP